MANTLTFANQTLTDANIFGGINYAADLNSGDELTIGNTASAFVSFVTDSQIPLYTKNSTNGRFTWTQDSTAKGRYYVTEVTKTNDMYTVEAYDAMYLLDTNISALSLSFPLTVSAAASAIATYIGCTVSGTINNGTMLVNGLDELLTVRQLLSYVAEASGCSVKIDGSDHLCFMYYAASNITVTASQYKQLEVADYTCAAIDKVIIFNSEGTEQASAGTGTNALYIQGNPFLEEATSVQASVILSQVSGLVYAPLKCEMFEENGLTIGTKATFGSTTSLVMHIESSESGAVATSVGSDSRAEYNKSIIQEINEAKAIAIDAQNVAGIAQQAASDAQTAAGLAQTAASAAETAASEAQTAAGNAQLEAGNAQISATAAYVQATSATAYSNAALGQLAIVENIVGVLDLIQKNGEYQLTADTDVQEGKWYFTRSGSGTSADPYIYSIVLAPSGDPSSLGYYEIIGIDAAIQNYVISHLAIDDDGLWLQTDGINSKVLLSATEGIVLYGPNGIIGKYGSTVQIGDAGSFHIEMDGTELGFYQAGNKVAYISNQQLYITQSVVLQQMDLGMPVADGGLGQWSWKVHANGQSPSKNNLNLKWIG